MTDLWKLSARDLAQGIREKDFSATEVVESVLNRIAAKNPDLNAITVEFPEQALAAAADADAGLARGDAAGPLHGVPVTIKENIDVAGQATPNGVPAFADLIASEDAPLVRNLRDAGAIIIGRTNVPEFSRSSSPQSARCRSHHHRSNQRSRILDAWNHGEPVTGSHL